MENTILKWVNSKGSLHFTLIDPEKQKPTEALKLAAIAQKSGSDAIMVGGSTIAGKIVDDTVEALTDVLQIPVILFPSGAGGFSRHADYLFFMSLLNSKDPRFLAGEQVKAAPIIAKTKVKTIPVGYIVVSTSRKPTAVERVGKVDRIKEKDTDKAVAYALTAQYYGMHCVYLEAGSGAEKPVPDKMVAAVKKAIDIPLIVGGGIRDPKTARKKIVAGADVIVTGTIAEKNVNALAKII
ncbi:MAG: geranylgeranylglyceryl/heptaprenylglyceryl phosphate synthase, partial [Candidatus Altiarchaeota archaeon]